MCWTETIIINVQLIVCQVCQIFDNVTRTCS